MNTPSNAGKEHNPDGLTPNPVAIGQIITVWREADDLIIMHVCGHDLRLSEELAAGLLSDLQQVNRTTPPTQSREGETEVDTAHKQFHAQDEYAHHPGVSLEFARNLHSRLTAAQRENDRLRSEVALIEWQNQENLTVTWNHLHGAFIVQGVNQVCGNMGRGQTVIEALRSARAATEEGKRG